MPQFKKFPCLPILLLMFAFMAAGTLTAPTAMGSGESSQDVYIVKPGDTLAKIALSAYGSVEQYKTILEANRDTIESANLIYPGQKLRIPGGMAAQAKWRFHDIVDVKYVQKYARLPLPDDAMIIDSRPKRPKYDKGHIPTAVSLPSSKFDQLTDKLPENKDTLLIFYCGGPTWKMSHKSARKAEKLGYTNAKVFDGGFPAWMKVTGSYAAIGVDHLAKLIESNEMVLIDSRPKKAKYDKGYIPTAVSLPDSNFDQLKGKLPRDLNTVVVFYCGGFTWKMSHDSARKAVKLGYKNAKVFAAGYPAWKKFAGSSATASGVPIKGGTEEGSIDIAVFKKIVEENPESIYLIDVRDANEYAQGHFKTAQNIPTDTLEKKVKELPSDKAIVFVCNTGAKSGEAYYMLQDLRPDLKKVYYLEATATYKKDGSYVLKKTEWSSRRYFLNVRQSLVG